MSKNPVAQYMELHQVGTVEMAERLGVSKGYVSHLKDGKKPITVKVAQRLGGLTGEPWWKYVPPVLVQQDGEVA